MTVTVSYDQLETAFMMIGDGMDTECYIDPTNGAIYCFDSMGESFDAVPPDFEPESAISVPDKYDLDLGNQLVFDFVRGQIPEHYDEVRDIFRRKGAYSRYKELLYRLGKEQDWYAYEARRTREALLEWCTDNGITLVD